MRSVALKEIHAMTKVAILPVPTEQGALSYHAVAGAKHAEGNTAGQALDAIAAQLSEAETSTLLIVQLRPDRFFTAAQQERLAGLMARWRTAQDEGHTLPLDEQVELEALVEAELRASATRAASLADALGQ
jgi:hypothetical protein